MERHGKKMQDMVNFDINARNLMKSNLHVFPKKKTIIFQIWEVRDVQLSIVYV